MKKILFTLLFSAGLLVPCATFSQALQVNPPTSSMKKVAFIPHPAYPSSFFFSEPQILSIDLSESGNKLVKLQQQGNVSSVSVADIQLDKNIEIKSNNIKNAVRVFFINDEYVALEISNESPIFEIIQIGTNEIVATIVANKYIGSTLSTAYFSLQKGENSTIEKFEIGTKKTSSGGIVSGEVFGWYFTKLNGIVGVVIHSKMVSRIYSMVNDKLGKSLFEFSSGYYFETKGCSSDGNVFYGITNFQSVNTYGCAISKTGIKPLNSKPEESCTDIFVSNNDVVLSTNSINAAEYQESQNSSIQKILVFAKESFKNSSVRILKISEKNNNILFCIQGEISKPKYFIWQANRARPVSKDAYDEKNLTFLTSEVVEIKTGDLAPQTGRMYLPTKNEKASYPLVIYIPENIFLPYTNQFNPTVQYLCQSGYAVFVWNTRYSFRPKIGFAYADLVGSFSEDISLVLASLKKEYAILPESSFIFGEGLGAYLALNASASNPDVFASVISNRIEFPGAMGRQDLAAARMFGEDAQSQLASPDRMSLSASCMYLIYQPSQSDIATRLSNAAKQNKLKWNEHSVAMGSKINSKELEEISTWIQQLSKIDIRVIDVKPKVEVKTK